MPPQWPGRSRPRGACCRSARGTGCRSTRGTGCRSTGTSCLPWWIPLAPAIEALRGALTPPLASNKATHVMGKLSSAPWRRVVVALGVASLACDLRDRHARRLRQ